MMLEIPNADIMLTKFLFTQNTHTAHAQQGLSYYLKLRTFACNIAIATFVVRASKRPKEKEMLKSGTTTITRMPG